MSPCPPFSSFITRCAAQFHLRGMLDRRSRKGALPCWKITFDSVGISLHHTNQCDLARTSYFDLPSDLRQENLAAASVVYCLLRCGDISDSYAGDFIHRAGLVRRLRDPHLSGAVRPTLRVPYAQLSTVEQSKDLIQGILGQQIGNQMTT